MYKPYPLFAISPQNSEDFVVGPREIDAPGLGDFECSEPFGLENP